MLYFFSSSCAGAKHSAIRTSGVVRLKPPPAEISSGKKVISLTNSGVSATNNSNKLVAKSNGQSISCAASKVELTSEVKSSIAVPIKLQQASKIKLNRPTTISESESVSKAVGTSSSSSCVQLLQPVSLSCAPTLSLPTTITQDKVKTIQKISWP